MNRDFVALAKEASSSLGEPKWALAARLSAAKELDKRGVKPPRKIREGKEKLNFKAKAGGYASAVRVCEAIESGNKMLKKMLGRGICGNAPESYLRALALFSDGIMISVENGKTAKAEVEFSGSAPEYFATFVFLGEKSASEALIGSKIQTPASECRTIIAESGAKSTLSYVQNNEEKGAFESGTLAAAGKNSEFGLLNCNIGGHEIMDSFLFLQNERGSICRHAEASISHQKQIFRKKCKHIHTAPDTHSESIFKYAASGESQVRVEGNVLISDGAKNAAAQFSAKSLLLSEKAKVRIKPNLFVHDESANAGHGAAASPMSGEEMFYLSSRGLSDSEAGRMLVSGFLADAVRRSGCEAHVDLVEKAIASAAKGAFAEGWNYD